MTNEEPIPELEPSSTVRSGRWRRETAWVLAGILAGGAGVIVGFVVGKFLGEFGREIGLLPARVAVGTWGGVLNDLQVRRLVAFATMVAGPIALAVTATRLPWWVGPLVGLAIGGAMGSAFLLSRSDQLGLMTAMQCQTIWVCGGLAGGMLGRLRPKRPVVWDED